MNDEGVTVGIDLGTTNSAIAYFDDAGPRLIPVDGDVLMPSVVGLSAEGELLVGQPARNQYQLYPERTARSVKRLMGSSDKLSLADRTLSPEEVSAIILGRLVEAARAHLGRPVDSAVITVPAFFSDAQRTATRIAGEIAQLEVVRIINEPTAAALCYVPADHEKEQLVLVYDLGGGTFDVSIVRIGAGVMEVLASHGDTALGGDDFDRALAAHLLESIPVGLSEEALTAPRFRARLATAAEQAKIGLSGDSYVDVAEESLAVAKGRPVHLDTEVSRADYVDLIEPMLQRTTDSISTALREAGVLARDLDEVLLVGGASRTPRVGEILHTMLGRLPRADIDPERAVALGAAILADRTSGGSAGPVLVDVSPYSFGTSYLGDLNGFESPFCYKIIIPRNTPLPCRKTEIFYTAADYQEMVDVEIFQGEQTDARANLRIGRFAVRDLDNSAAAGSPILFELALDLDGILDVTVTEKRTGLKKNVVIADAFKKLSEKEIGDAKARVAELIEPQFSQWSTPSSSSNSAGDEIEVPPSVIPLLSKPPEGLDESQRSVWSAAQPLLERGQLLLSGLSEPDRGEVESVVESLMSALRDGDMSSVEDLSNQLNDILFYLE